MYIRKKIKRNIAVVVSLVLMFDIGFVSIKHLRKQSNFPLAANIVENSNKDLSKDLPNDDIILTINDTNITYEKYKYYLDKEKLQIDNGDNNYWKSTNKDDIMENSKTTKLELENAVLQKIKSVVALENLQQEYDIIVTEEEVEKEYLELLSMYGQETIDDLLVEKNLTLELYKEMLKNSLIEEELLIKMFAEEIYNNLDISKIAGYKKILITYSDTLNENYLNQEIRTSQAQSDNLLLRPKNMENPIENSDEVENSEESILETTEDVIQENIELYEDLSNKQSKKLLNQYTAKSITNIDYEKQNNKLINNSLYNQKQKSKEITQNIVVTKIDNGIGEVRKLTQVEAKDLIDNIYNQLEQGADFDNLLSIYGEDIEFVDLLPEYVMYGDLNEPYNTKLFELQTNEYSTPFVSELGLEIIIRLEPSREYIDENIIYFAPDEIWNRYSKIVSKKINDLVVTKNKNYVYAFANAFSNNKIE